MDIRLNLETDTVEQAKADEMLTVAPHLSIHEVFKLMQLHGTGSVLVCDNLKLVGIFTERDALRLMATDADLSGAVESVMIKDPVTVPRGASLAQAVRSMSTGGYRRLPIVDDNGELLGVVKVSGILHYFVDHFPETVFNLPPEPNVVMPEREGA